MSSTSVSRIIINIKNKAKTAARSVFDLYDDRAAARDIAAIYKAAHTSDVIRVGFIVQMPEIWDKEEPIYLAMKESPDFSTELIVVPGYDLVSKSVGTDFEGNYFLEKYDDAIPAFENNRWIDLSNRYDFVFFQRPYDVYLPKELRSRSVRKYAKCCYLPYGFAGADVFNAGAAKKSFYRNISYAFLESDHTVELVKNTLAKNDRLHHVENLGYPALEPYFSIRPEGKYRSFLWTPRWSYDEKLGGSRFLEYKDAIVTIAESWPEDSLVFRPHPLLFGEMVAKGFMTEREIDNYLALLDEKGVRLDKGNPLFETFKGTDVLIADFSSIIIQFFITGRPIIYCEAGIELNELYRKMSEGFYIAHDEEELMGYVEMLKRGEDPLFSVRQQIINEHLSVYKNGTDAIVERIRQDWETLYD